MNRKTEILGCMSLLELISSSTKEIGARILQIQPGSKSIVELHQQLIEGLISQVQDLIYEQLIQLQSNDLQVKQHQINIQNERDAARLRHAELERSIEEKDKTLLEQEQQLFKLTE